MSNQNTQKFSKFHAPVCYECQISMNVDENGIYVIDTFLDPPQPYQIWSADLWVCPICEHRFVNGFGNNAVRHNIPGFQDLLKTARDQTHVYAYEKVVHAEMYAPTNPVDLAPGLWVDIYQKPFTAEEFEERAVLISKIENSYEDPGVQRWMVQFSDGMIVQRTIMVQYANASTDKYP